VAPLPAGDLARPGGLTLTERNWLLAVLVVAAFSALFGGILALEHAYGAGERGGRFVYDAFETSTRYFAIAHILVGTSFLLSSRAMARPAGRLWFVGLLGAGVLASYVFQWGGGKQAHLASAIFYAYFFVHEIRDEAFFYRANGDACGVDGEMIRRDILRIPALALGILLGVFLIGGAWGIGGARRYAGEVIGDWGRTPRLALGAAILVLTVTWAHTTVRGLRRRHGGLLPFVRAHRPILVVYGGTFLLIFLGVVFTGRLSLIVAIHVAAWYVFATRSLRAAPAPVPRPRPFSWTWMRRTNVGFQTLHIGLFVLLMAIGLVWAYGFGNDPDQRGMYVLVSRDAFPFWTIMHVTLSFTPR
jgi:hypothetical protein